MLGNETGLDLLDERPEAIEMPRVETSRRTER